MSGKGSTRRPQEVPDEQVQDNWSRIFGGVLPDDIELPQEEKGNEDVPNSE
jgi:hypothetical protein